MLSRSFSSEKSYSPSRLKCRQAAAEPWATASRNLEGKSKYCLRWKLLKTAGESKASRSTVLRTFVRA